ncbi:MAG: glycerol-3-phosphate dehydrogenase subunit GlpB [Muribaculaceae bacterium]
MKFDTIIIGGGLTGLTCGISLIEKGQNCAIISSGQSAMHFCSGSFDLLGYVDGKEVANPLSAISSLPSTHPYSIIGSDNIAKIVGRVEPMFARVGLKVNGTAEQNHYRITPSGTLRPTWLSLDDFTIIKDKSKFPWKTVSIQNISGFLDFNTSFIADGLERLGAKCSISSFSIPELERIRKSPSEMRSTNIAKVFDHVEVLEKLGKIIVEKSLDSEVIVLPAVFGLYNQNTIAILRTIVDKPLCLLPALPPSVPGIRAQIMMKQHFLKLGGTYMLGDTVTGGEINDVTLKSINTANHGDIKLEADNFVLSSGSFFSHGIIANSESVYEPIFGLDVNAEADRRDWCDSNIFNNQPYMSFGVATDSEFHAQINGKAIKNLYVAGSVMSGSNALKEASGAGISILTALHVSDIISK